MNMKNTSTPLKIGAIGCGFLATNYHHAGISQLAELSLSALCDIDTDRLAAGAKKYQVEQTFTDFRRMLDECDLDAVCIVGPPSMHVEAVKVCLDRQIPFMVEKPIAPSLAEARELAQLADEKGNCGMVAFTSRAAPAQRLAWRISRSEEFGPVCYVATTHLTQAQMVSTWGISDKAELFIYCHGVHAIDLWRFFGGDPVWVSANLARERTDHDGFGYGSILAAVRTADGVHGTIHMKAGNAHNGNIDSDVMSETRRVRVQDEQVLNYEGSREWVSDFMKDDLLADTFPIEYPVSQSISPGLISYSYYGDFFRFEWLAFARALSRGIALSPSVQDGYRTICVADAVARSLRADGEPVKVVY